MPDNSQGQEQSSSPRKQAVRSKFNKSSFRQEESAQAKGFEAGKQRKAKHNNLLKDVTATGNQRELKEVSHVPNKVNKKRERKGSKIPVPTKELLKNFKREEIGTELKQNDTSKDKKHRKNISLDGHKVSRNTVENAGRKPAGNLALQSDSHARSNSPPVPALANKLEKAAVNSMANASIDHNLPSLSTHNLSKRAQQKAAKKLHSGNEEISIPLANSVVRRQQSSMQNPQQQHYEQITSVSPPVPTVAKKLQVQLLQKSSVTEFDSHNRSVLPPITDIRPIGETGLEDTVAPTHNPQYILPSVSYSSQPVVEFKSNSPPVPALAKKLNQQQSLTLNHSNNHHSALTHTNHNRSMSPELNSDSQFTSLPEMERRFIQATDLQQTQPIMYIPISPHQIPTLYPQCSLNDPMCFQNSQQAYCVGPQVVSPVQVMIPPFSFSPPQTVYQQTDIEKRRENSNATMNEDVSQSHTHYAKHQPSTVVDTSVQEQDNANSRDNQLLHLPPIVATTIQDKADNDNKHHIIEQSSPSVAATSQLSQQKEAVLQHLAIMKKVQLCTCIVRTSV